MLDPEVDRKSYVHSSIWLDASEVSEISAFLALLRGGGVWEAGGDGGAEEAGGDGGAEEAGGDGEAGEGGAHRDGEIGGRE